MKIKKFLAVLTLCLGIGFPGAHAEQQEFYIYFEPGSAEYKPNLSDNAATLAKIQELLKAGAAKETITIENIYYYGLTSPEASFNLNEELALERKNTIEQKVKALADYPASLPEGNLEEIDLIGGIAWSQLKSLVSKSDYAGKAKILDIINQEPRLVPYRNGKVIDARVLELQKLDKGKAWKYIHDNFFPQMRSAVAIFIVEKVAAPVVETIEVTEIEEEVAAPTPKEPFIRKIYIKTNAVGWLMSNANIAGEVDICRHLSFALPIYYSAIDYLTYKWKFRTLSFQPEFRYWFSPVNDKFFIGAHFGLGYYNIAFGGNERYQDRNGNTPAIGGGLSLGYRLPISKNKRWKLEFSVGAGAYSLHYDTFRNVKNGAFTGSHKKTYVGLDQISVGFSYTFNLKK